MHHTQCTIHNAPYTMLCIIYRGQHGVKHCTWIRVYTRLESVYTHDLNPCIHTTWIRVCTRKDYSKRYFIFFWPSTFYPRLFTLDPRRFTLDPRRFTLDPRLATLDQKVDSYLIPSSLLLAFKFTKYCCLRSFKSVLLGPWYLKALELHFSQLVRFGSYNVYLYDSRISYT